MSKMASSLWDCKPVSQNLRNGFSHSYSVSENGAALNEVNL